MGCGAGSNRFPMGIAPSVAGRWGAGGELAGGLGTGPDEDVAGGPAPSTGSAAITSRRSTCWPRGYSFRRATSRKARAVEERLGREIPTCEVARLQSGASPADVERDVGGGGAELRETLAGASAAGRGKGYCRRQALAALRRAGGAGLQFLYDRSRHLLAIGYNVGDHRARRELLRPARLRGAARQLRRDRAGPAAAGALVRPRPPADTTRTAGRRCSRGAARCSST